MRLVTYDGGDGPRAGVLEDGRVVDAWALLGEPHRAGLRELLEHDRVDNLRPRLGDTGAPSHPLSAVRLLPPIPDPEKIVCIGLNYAAHAAEGREEVPKSPTIFGKFRNALAAPGATVTLPAASAKVDYEGEIAFVIGRRGAGARPPRRLHALQRPLGPRPAVRDAAVDGRQGLRRLGAERSLAGHA
jgi:2-keto-4-pentenoate hydratase/2-oxohepta-3-ene-1,7-dioic acid hydratase in catechol pathway